MAGTPKLQTRRRSYRSQRKSQLLQVASSNESNRREHRSVVHFYHSNFKRCELMDKHLAVCPLLLFNLCSLIGSRN